MGDYESSPSYNSSSSLSKKLFLGSGDASEFNIKPLTLIDPSLYDGEVKRRQRKVSLNHFVGSLVRFVALTHSKRLFFV